MFILQLPKGGALEVEERDFAETNQMSMGRIYPYFHLGKKKKKKISLPAQLSAIESISG